MPTKYYFIAFKILLPVRIIPATRLARYLQIAGFEMCI